MPENENNQNAEPKLATFGAVTRVTEFTNSPKQHNVEPTNSGSDEVGEHNEAKGVVANVGSGEGSAEAGLTEQQIADYFKAKGIDFTSVDDVVQRLGKNEEVKHQADTNEDLDKKSLEVFVKSGGTEEGYVALKQIANMDLTELSKVEIKKELTDAGFSETEIEAVMIERYYQLNPEEIEQDIDESDEEYEERVANIKKRVEYGKNKLSKKGERVQNQAKEILQNILSSISESDTQKDSFEKTEAAIAAKTDAIFGSLPKKYEYELGKAPDDSPLLPVQYSVDEADLESVKALLKNREERNKLFFNEDGELNLESVSQILVENINLKKAMKVAYLEGGSRQTEAFRKVFPHRSPYEVGINGSGKSTPSGNGGGKAVSIGATRRVQ